MSLVQIQFLFIQLTQTVVDFPNGKEGFYSSEMQHFYQIIFDYLSILIYQCLFLHPLIIVGM